MLFNIKEHTGGVETWIKLRDHIFTKQTALLKFCSVYNGMKVNEVEVHFFFQPLAETYKTKMFV